MRVSKWLMTAVVASVAGCAQPTPEQRIVNEAAQALGGRDRVLNVKTIALEGEGRQFNLGQDMRPDAADQTFTVSGFTRRQDLAAHRSRTELTRTPTFAYFQGQAPQRQIQGIDGDVAYNIAANDTAARVATPVASDRKADLLHHPVAIVRAAASPGATVTNARTAGAERLVDITADGRQFVLAVDSTGLPVRVESKSDNPNLGDVILSTHFADYQDVSGVKMPTRITTAVDDFTTGEFRFTRQTIDGDIGDLAAPAAAAASPAAAGPPPPEVVPEQVAPWIWLLAGQSHHSVLLEMQDHLLLIDAPQSEARTLAVLAKVRELKPDKPLSAVITTHHHFDHTAGIRAAIAAGLSIVTHTGNKAFFEAMGRRPHTILPDTLARSPKAVSVTTVDDELILNDGPAPVAIYHVAGNPHSDTMLMVHIPSERVLIEVDAFSPGAAVHPYAANLLENITRRNLRVERIVSLHGGIAPFADLAKVAVPATIP
jgi:glyoxylase-like metal-dependent hydrolase (beta-lactamase superfamily II)